MNTEWHDQLITDAKRHYLTVERIDDTVVQLRYESEFFEVPVTTLLEFAGSAQSPLFFPRIRAFFAGMSAAIRLPPAKGFSFSDAVGTLLPRVVSPEFLIGYRSASPVALFELPLAPGLVAVYLVEGDYVYSYLSRSRVEAWGVTDDRISYAARSNLYHSTIKFNPTAADLPVKHERFDKGDGFDSGRVLLLNDIFWDRVETGLYFAIPSDDMTLIADITHPREAEMLKRTVEELFVAANHPVSPNLYRQHKKVAHLVNTEE